jgi:voltage-gated potassium channel
VGYGDLAPSSVLGQIIASLMMITGYAIIAVPTGIVGAEWVRNSNSETTKACDDCGAEGHRNEAGFCFRCGATLG